MKKCLLLLVLVLFLSGMVSAQVNGQLTNLGDRYILHVWGSHYERGYALGNLMGTNIMTIFSNYFFTYVAQNSVTTYNYFLNFHQTNYSTDPRYISEAEGVIAGMQASGISMYHNALQRDLNVQDILLVNAIVDIAYLQSAPELELGCSSLASWGAATLDDPELQGALLITRLLDWTRNQSLVVNPLLVVHHPSEADEFKWISFTYPGLFGALSAITEYDAAAFLDIGNMHTNVDPTNLSAVLLDARSGLERRDYNSDGIQSTEDLYSAVSDGKHISGTLIHNVQQFSDSCRAAVIETNNTGTVRRLHDQNSGISGANLAATNHFRMLYDPVYCSRYSKIIDSLNVSAEVTSLRQWNLMRGAGGVSSNLMMIQYAPTLGRIKWSVATTSQGAYTQPAMEFDLPQLFIQPSAVTDELAPIAPLALKVFPNPFHLQDQLQIQADKQLRKLAVYNLRGQIIHSQTSLAAVSSIAPEISLTNQSSGVYILQAESYDGSRASAKILYLK